MTPRSVSTSPIFYLGLLLIILAIFGLQLGLYSQLSRILYPNSNSQAHANLLTVNTLINYGNGTIFWHNRTDIPVGWNFYQLTISIATVQASSSPTLGNEHFVKAIDGVAASGPYYWTLWLYCQGSKAWFASPVGADLIKLSNDQALAWFYQNPPSSDPSTWKPPVPGSATVPSCG